MRAFDRLLGRRLLVCLGPGGVGKTTIAAALGLGAARRGRRSLILAVDPARRLGTTLGGARLGEQPTAVPIPLALGATSPDGSLAAAMLDRAQGWERLVRRHARTPEAAARLLANPLYPHLSRRFAGVDEYLAVDGLVELWEQGGHDLLVVDTPPSHHALALLEAPARLRSLFDPRLARWLAAVAAPRPPSPLGRLSPSRYLRRRLGDATSQGTLAALGDLFAAVGGLVAGVSARGLRFDELIRTPEAAVVVITTADPTALARSAILRRELARLAIPLGAVVVNRLHPTAPIDPLPTLEALAAELAPSLGAPLDRWVADRFLAHQTLARGQAHRLAALRRELPATVPILTAPTLPDPPDELSGLAHLAAALGGDA